jgi:hypothetical protein
VNAAPSGGLWWHYYAPRAAAGTAGWHPSQVAVVCMVMTSGTNPELASAAEGVIYSSLHLPISQRNRNGHCMACPPDEQHAFKNHAGNILLYTYYCPCQKF